MRYEDQIVPAMRDGAQRLEDQIQKYEEEMKDIKSGKKKL